jgi:hypothetical protein
MSNLEQITCVAIIIAMAVVIIKAFSYPLSNFFRAINPMIHYRMWQSLSNRVEDLNMEIFMLKDELKNLKKKK